MATTQSTDSKAVGTVDAQAQQTARTVVADIVTEELRLTDWDVFRTVSECSEETIHRLRE